MTYFSRFAIPFSLMLTLALPALGNDYSSKKAKKNAPHRESTLEQLDEEDAKAKLEEADRSLASGDSEDDLSHYHSMSRRMGVDLGMLIPMGDYQKSFGNAPVIGVHIAWVAIDPFNLVVSLQRASAPNKDGSSNAKLSVTSLNVGTQASFGAKRFSPFVKLEGSFQFNDVNFNDTRKVVTGNDYNLTSVGLNAGIGIDFIVGREVSVGLDVTYHYAVPKKLTFDDNSTFDLGSPYITTGLRVNF